MAVINAGVRAIQRTRYSRHVNLPAWWCDHHDLDQGAKVEISILDDGSLLIRPAPKTEVRT